ncbi:MAG: MFS transporter [Patescibacteria group bacterium]|nr:MFS transporter [Patescibacteria group bacterium]
MFNKHFKIWWFQIVQTLISSGFIAILYIRFFQSSISLSQIIFAEFIATFFSALYLICAKKINFRLNMVLGFLSGMLGFAFILFFGLSFPFFLAYTFFKGMSSVLFFVVYNILFFRETKNKKELHRMTVYWAIGIISGVLAPFIGSYILNKFGLVIFAVVAIFVLLVGIYLVKNVKKEKLEYRSKDILKSIKGLRILNLFDGAFHKVIGFVIPIFALLYIKTEFDYAKFLSLISIVSIFFAFGLAKKSDRTRQRMPYIWIFSLLSFLIMIGFYFSNSFIFFLLLVFALKAVTVMFEPLRSNMILDHNKNNSEGWISREFYLLVGRSILFFVLFIMLHFNFVKESYLFFSVLYLVFPFIVKNKKIYAKID